MDEIDAALDFKNVSIVGHYIKVKLCFQSVHFVKIKLATTWILYNYVRFWLTVLLFVGLWLTLISTNNQVKIKIALLLNLKIWKTLAKPQ